MASVAAYLMAHPLRQPLLDETILPAWLPYEPTVVMDPEPEGERGCWRTAALMYTLASLSPTSHVILGTDDALPCPRFHEAAERIADLTGQRVVSFYSARKAVPEALARGDHWAVIPGRDWLNPMGLMLPTMLLRDVIRWIKRDPAPYAEKWTIKSDDTRIRDYLIAHKMSVHLSAPSLVEHYVPGESLIGNGNPNRKAAVYQGNEDPLKIDWTKGL